MHETTINRTVEVTLLLDLLPYTLAIGFTPSLYKTSRRTSADTSRLFLRLGYTTMHLKLFLGTLQCPRAWMGHLGCIATFCNLSITIAWSSSGMTLRIGKATKFRADGAAVFR